MEFPGEELVVADQAQVAVLHGDGAGHVFEELLVALHLAGEFGLLGEHLAAHGAYRPAELPHLVALAHVEARESLAPGDGTRGAHHLAHGVVDEQMQAQKEDEEKRPGDGQGHEEIDATEA